MLLYDDRQECLSYDKRTYDALPDLCMVLFLLLIIIFLTNTASLETVGASYPTNDVRADDEYSDETMKASPCMCQQL